MATPPFHYQHMFPLGPDKTEYYLLTKDYVSVSEFEGKPILKIEKEGLTAMANAAFRDVSFLLRRSHNEQVAKILSDPEASDNDKYVALTFLRNAEVSAKGKLPLCQDTGTAMTSCLLPVMNTGVLSAMWNWKNKYWKKLIRLVWVHSSAVSIWLTMSASSACPVTVLLVLSVWVFPVLLTVI